ncbi:hypothetical protein MMC17_008317 [Xylographa soralifera]|nr:hypothetical protein [Xylographa soralifera]
MYDLYIVSDCRSDRLSSGIICLSEDYENIIVLVDSKTNCLALLEVPCGWKKSSVDPDSVYYIRESYEDTARRLVTTQLGKAAQLRGYAMKHHLHQGYRMVHCDLISPVHIDIDRGENPEGEKPEGEKPQGSKPTPIKVDLKTIKLGEELKDFSLQEISVKIAIRKLAPNVARVLKLCVKKLPKIPISTFGSSIKGTTEKGENITWRDPDIFRACRDGFELH